MSNFQKNRDKIKAHLRKKQGGNCYYCKRPLNDAVSIDHIKPKSKGGTNAQDNLALTCRPCNQFKCSMAEAVFKRIITADRPNKKITKKIIRHCRSVSIQEMNGWLSHCWGINWQAIREIYNN